MGYSYVPKEALPAFISTLCRVVNMEEHCNEAWRIMSSLMATHLGHSALYNLCQIAQLQQFAPPLLDRQLLQERGGTARRPERLDVSLVRGAVFFIGMSLWGSKCVDNMQRYSPMTILPTFIQALRCRNHVVTYEITLQVRDVLETKLFLQYRIISNVKSQLLFMDPFTFFTTTGTA